MFIIGRRFNVVQETANELTDAAASAQSGGQCIPIEGDVATKKGVSDVYEKIVNLTDRVHSATSLRVAADYQTARLPC